MKLAALLFCCVLPLSAYAQESSSHHPHDEGGHSHDHEAGTSAGAIEAFTVPASEVSPEYLQLATNVEVIPNIETAVTAPSAIMTHEGLFGPLLFAEQTRAFFIELQPGMFLAEHPHDTGSIVYTVRGRWVLASEGKRQVMESGSLFRFGDGMPTGWEAPFGEGALLLIVKPKGDSTDYEVFHHGIEDMREMVEADRQSGGAYYYNALKSDHPAILFAHSINPDFDKVLESID